MLECHLICFRIYRGSLQCGMCVIGESFSGQFCLLTWLFSCQHEKVLLNSLAAEALDCTWHLFSCNLLMASEGCNSKFLPNTVFITLFLTYCVVTVAGVRKTTHFVEVTQLIERIFFLQCNSALFVKALVLWSVTCFSSACGQHLLFYLEQKS